MDVRESAGGIVLNGNGEIAVVKNGPDFWGFPKGHIDPGEDALTAAKREIREETGLKEITFVRELGAYERMGGPGYQEKKRITMFLFTTRESALAPEDGDNPEARWVAQSEVAAMLTNEVDRDFYERVLPLINQREPQE